MRGISISKSISRRGFNKLILQAVAAWSAFLSGCVGARKSPTPFACDPAPGAEADEYDYIIVGSGAGGGPLAANLAGKGYRVLLVEAGGDEDTPAYQIPLFHPLASEDPEMRWDFFVRHFSDRDRSRQDRKFSVQHDGVLYPRASALGGCTAHNAMILVYPHNEDWEHIARLTGDPSWGSEQMRTYFERMENCRYLTPAQAGHSRHGFTGWLPTSLPSFDTMLAVIRDHVLRDVLLGSVVTALQKHLGKPLDLIKSRFDPNHWDYVRNNSEGLCKVPLTTADGRRAGPRDYIRAVQKSCGSRLTVKLHTLATRLILEEAPPGSDGKPRKRAVGIEYLQGRKAYRADRNPAVAAAAAELVAGQIRARREVILAGGAFNTPQLLMLSGIGPQQHLQEHGIAVQIDLPGVGENLQDRYEVAVVTEMKREFSLLKGMDFHIPQAGDAPNPYYEQWQRGQGVYSTNGAVLAFIKKSAPQLPNPDLFVFGMPGYFPGYELDYSKRVAADQKHFTWAILKAHTNNTGGTVRLKSADPRERPVINFHYFDEGTDAGGADLEALVSGMEFVREITHSRGMSKHIAAEVVPGPACRSRQDLKQFAMHNAWGHHASCSCRIGANDDPQAVLDSRFRVRHVDNLRIVDASVFPRIPGFFIVSAVYMISEKAAEVIHEDAEIAARKV